MKKLLLAMLAVASMAVVGDVLANNCASGNCRTGNCRNGDCGRASCNKCTVEKHVECAEIPECTREIQHTLCAPAQEHCEKMVIEKKHYTCPPGYNKSGVKKAATSEVVRQPRRMAKQEPVKAGKYKKTNGGKAMNAAEEDMGDDNN